MPATAALPKMSPGGHSANSPHKTVHPRTPGMPTLEMTHNSPALGQTQPLNADDVNQISSTPRYKNMGFTGILDMALKSNEQVLQNIAENNCYHEDDVFEEMLNFVDNPSAAGDMSARTGASGAAPEIPSGIAGIPGGAMGVNFGADVTGGMGRAGRAGSVDSSPDTER